MKTTFTVYEVSYNWCDDIDCWFIDATDAEFHANDEVAYEADHRKRLGGRCEAGDLAADVFAVTYTIEDGDESDDLLALAGKATAAGVPEDSSKLVKTVTND